MWLPVSLLVASVLSAASGASYPGRLPTTASAASPLPEAIAYNVIVILVDDLGLDQLSLYDDINQYNCPYPYAFTPNLASLAANGVRFTQARSAPICSPSRAQLHSSRYGRHTGCGTNVTKLTTSASFREFNVEPARTQLTLPRALPSSYANTLIGKVHMHLLRDPWEGFPLPSSQGATGDLYAVSYDLLTLGGGLGYQTWAGTARNANGIPNPPVHPGDSTNLWRHFGFSYYNWIRAGGANPGRFLVEGCALGVSAPLDTAITLPFQLPVGCDPTTLYQGKYITRAEREELDAWITALEPPFFALWAMNDVHRPPQWPPVHVPFLEEGHRFGATEPPPDHMNTRLRAKIETMDTSVGLLMRRLNDLGLLDSTVVILVGDNGTQGGGELIIQNDEVPYPAGHPLHPYSSFPCAQPIGGPAYSIAPYDLAHFKGSVYEQGVRVPLIVWGPPTFFGEAGTGWTSNALVDLVDIYETVLQITSGSNYTPPVPCGSSQPNDCRDGLSFLSVLQGVHDADTHARQFSHNGSFAPNSWPPTPDLDSNVREFYVRREGAQLWKIVRHYQPGSPNGCYRDEFYELNSDPLETNDLGTTSTAYTVTATEFAQRFPLFYGLPRCP